VVPFLPLEEIRSMDKLKNPDFATKLVLIRHFKNGRVVLGWLVLVSRTSFVLVFSENVKNT
jgi:hypothetical protein